MTNSNFPRYYILNNRVPFAVDLMTWARWFENMNNRRVKVTVIDAALGVRVSTVFLGLDHNFGYSVVDDPVLFETMAFHGSDDISCARYCTWDQAVAGHARVVTEIAAMMADTKTSAENLLSQIVAKIS